MIKSLTYDKTKALGQQLVTAGLVSKCYLQARKIQIKKGVTIGIDDGAEFIDIITNKAPMVAYFRDLGKSIFEQAQTESCFPQEYIVTTDVRLVVFSDKEMKAQSNFAEILLSQLQGVTIKAIETNQYEMLNTEVEGEKGKVYSDGLTVGVMVDFVVRERRQWNIDCPPAGVCVVNDLVIC